MGPNADLILILLLLRCRIDDAAFIWVIGLSFFYLWQRQQHHPSIVGICLLRWLHRPSFNRRSVRSVHPGARVLDVPVYTLYRQKSLPPRPSQHCCLYFWLEDLALTRFPFRNLLVL